MNNKRLILIIMIFGIILVAFFRRGDNGTVGKFAAPNEKLAHYNDAVSKLKDGSLWKPAGWGSGEYISTIPIIKAGAVVDLDSGEVLWSMNLKQRTATASLSKLATVMTALDVSSPDKLLTVSDDASEQIPTKLGLKTGEKLKLSEAVDGAILTSANDATETIADSLGREVGIGTQSFMDLVNLKLGKIGAVDSHFVTATGLDAHNHYSTVYDLAIVAHEAWRNYPQITDVARQSFIHLDGNGNHRQIDLPNWNALLGTYPGVNGLKIGYTEDAGYCTIDTASRDGKNLVVVVLGAKSIEDRESAGAVLLNYGFAKRGVATFPIAALELKRRYADWQRELSYGGR
ncbi:MAG TPA: hypothetical protein VLE91_03420 [Candidatus Saccharimonadales bacterium]|nr:hypothetical protein [Candidatus Saccharimonadales bacterium]